MGGDRQEKGAGLKIWDLIRDFKAKWGCNSGSKVCTECGMPKINREIRYLAYLKAGFRILRQNGGDIRD